MSDEFVSTQDSTAAVLLAAAPAVQVTAPNGGEIVTAGARITVGWTAAGDITNQRVQFTLDGVSFTPIATGLAPDVRSVPWDVPATLVPAGQSDVQVRIRVVVTNTVTGEQASDLSDLPFTVRAIPTVQVTAPAASTTVDVGAVLPIQWSSSAATNHRVQFVEPNGTVTPIVTGLDGTARSFSWSIPLSFVPAGQQKSGVIRVFATNATGSEQENAY